MGFLRTLGLLLFCLFLSLVALHSASVLAQADCTQIVSRLKDFTTRVNENNYAVANFVGEVSIALDGFYNDYSQMEDSTIAIAPDFFSPLSEAANGIGETVNVAYEQMDILDQEGQGLVGLVEKCLAAPVVPATPEALTP